MVREVRARFHKGRIEPLEHVDFKEGDEFVITVTEEPTNAAKDALSRAAGAWKGTLDFDAYLKDLYATRREAGREVRL